MIIPGLIRSSQRLAAAFLVCLLASALLLAGEFTATFLDSGQGDAIVLKTPAGKICLIDTGPNDEEYGGHFDAGRDVGVPFLASRNTEEIEAILISHPHLDHYGGAWAVISSFTVREIVSSRRRSKSPPYLKLMEAISAKKIPLSTVAQGDTLDWDPELKVQVLWPPKNFKGSDNNSSVVLHITHGKNMFLFPGDAEREAEEEMVQTYGPGLRSDVLKAPHHGSKTSSTEEFLDAVSPSLAVISCGRKNKYGHPYPNVLERFEERNITFYRTDLDGTVEIISDGENLSIRK